eukprot:141344_1
MGCNGSKAAETKKNDEAAYDIKTKAKVAGKAPIGVEVEEGKTYYYCTCGLSKNQPWCDGSHVTGNEENGTDFKPLAYTADKTETKYFCACKQTDNAPFCDGSHTKLPADDEKKVDEAAYDIKTKAKVAGKAPIGVEVEEGKTYYYCTCGLSKNQPFCDGSHVEGNKENGTEFAPLAWTAEKAETKYFCACKQTETAPFCDGAHAKLPADDEEKPVDAEVADKPAEEEQKSEA